jgi:hypothetical protein
MCKAGKSTKKGKYMMNQKERSLRTAWRKERTKEDPVVAPAPSGSYFD